MTRTRLSALILCILAGCSTHPITDTCDYLKPGKLGPNKVEPYGGVAIPQGAIIPAGIPSVGVPTAPPVGVIPGPAPLPGSAPTTLQPPIPPPPPPPPRNF